MVVWEEGIRKTGSSVTIDSWSLMGIETICKSFTRTPTFSRRSVLVTAAATSAMSFFLMGTTWVLTWSLAEMFAGLAIWIHPTLSTRYTGDGCIALLFCLKTTT